MIKAVIFDFDGVILDSEAIHEQTWETLLGRYGIPFTNQMKIDVKGRSARDNLRKILGSRFKDEHLTPIVQERIKLFQGLLRKDMKLIKGVEVFLKALRDHNYKIGLATASIKQNLAMVFETYSIKKLFDVIVSSEDVTHGKPHPEIFLKAASLLGIKSVECLVFEDALTGMEAAQRAGMKVGFIISSFELPESYKPDLAIKDFSQITVEQLKKL